MNAKTRTLAGFAVLDVVLLAMACLIPTASHLLAVPLYMLNPMLALLLAGMLVGRDWRNALLLAVLMPLVSCLLVGMPTAPKMVCMMAELATVAGLFHVILKFGIQNSKINIGVLPAVLVSVLVAKVVYYILKALILAPAVLVGTAWWMQLGAAIVWCGLFAILYKRLK